MAKSLFNGSNIESIQYVSGNGGQAVVAFSSGGNGDVKMLIDSAQASFQRGIALKRFINSGPALLAGKGQGRLRLQGVFGSADQLTALCGEPDNLCAIARDLTLSAGVLKGCGDAENNTSSVNLVLHNCVVESFNVTVTMQQDGVVFQGADITMMITDVSVA